MASQTFPLNHGKRMPALGLGTWKSEKGKVKDAVAYALKEGYRLIDCAYCYGNEVEVGEGLKEAFESGIKREDIFVVTKVWSTYNTRVALGLEKSLQRLGLEFVDLYLVHWPVLMNPDGNDDRVPMLPDGTRDIIRSYNHLETWAQMEKALDSGKTKAIGVSNYSQRYLEQILKHSDVVPAVNQIENHPALPQQELMDYCKENEIHIMAYSPLGSTGGPLTKAEPVLRIAEKHRVQPSTVLLSYHNVRGSTVIPKSISPERIKANMKFIKLDSEDMQLLKDYADELTSAGKLQRFVYPPFGVDLGFPDKS